MSRFFRSTWTRYGLLLLTDGFFGFVWVVMLMREINRLYSARIFPVLPLGGVLLGGCALYLLLFLEAVATHASPSSALFGVLWILAPLLVGYWMVLIVLIYRRARLFRGSPFAARHAFLMIGLTLLVGLSLVVIQTEVNAARPNGTAPKIA